MGKKKYTTEYFDMKSIVENGDKMYRIFYVGRGFGKSYARQIFIERNNKQWERRNTQQNTLT